MRRKQSNICYNGEDYERVVSRQPCMCTEMDYECDFGYTRHFSSQGQCEIIVKQSSWDNAALK